MPVSRVSKPKIDYDTLVAIMKSMEGPHFDIEAKRAISVLSRTCRHLYLEGVKSLLARGVWLLSTTIASFGLFILADPISRGPLLRNLEIDVRVVSVAALDVFVMALSHTTHLNRLRLDALEELPRATAKRLCTALGSLTSVRELTIYYSGRDYARRVKRDPTSNREEYFPKLLRRLHSSLKSVTLQLPTLHDNEACVIYKRDRDPIFLLSDQRGSLEHVALSGNITVGGHKCVYPRVTRLSLHEWGLPLLQPYIASFPNVSTIDFLYDAMFRRYAKHINVLDLRRVGLPLKEWHNINARNQVTSGTWPRIQLLQGTILDAYAYGISCPVTRLHLLSVGGDHSDELAMLSAIFADTIPSVLRLAVKAWFGRDCLPILPPASPLDMCLMSLEIRINVILQMFDPDAYFDYATDMLRSMRIPKSFQLEFRCLNTSIRNLEANMSGDRNINGSGIYCSSPEDGIYGRCYLQDTMDHVDLYQRVRELMAAAPALRRVALMWKRCRHSRWDAPPDRVVGIDLDLIPHSVDRRGTDSDVWCDGDW